MLLVPVIINSTAISLSWGEVNCTDRNGAITGYSVQYSIVGGIQSTTVNVTGDVTCIVIDGLTEFTIYTFSVAAINNIGVGNYSDDQKSFIGIMHAGALSLELHRGLFLGNTQILNLSASWSIQYVLLSWEPLKDRNNITFEYEVVYSIDSECSSDSFPDDGYTVYSPRTTNSSIEVFGLMSGTCYVFGVRAYVLNNISGVISFISGATISEGNRHNLCLCTCVCF